MEEDGPGVSARHCRPGGTGTVSPVMTGPTFQKGLAKKIQILL